MSAKASQTGVEPDHYNDRPSVKQFNANTVWAQVYIAYKDFDLADHVLRAAIVDVARADGVTDGGRVVYDDPRDDGIEV